MRQLFLSACKIGCTCIRFAGIDWCFDIIDPRSKSFHGCDRLSRNGRTRRARESDGRWRTVAIVDEESWIFGTQNSRAGARSGAEGGRRAVRVAPPCEQPAREVSPRASHQLGYSTGLVPDPSNPTDLKDCVIQWRAWSIQATGRFMLSVISCYLLIWLLDCHILVICGVRYGKVLEYRVFGCIMVWKWWGSAAARPCDSGFIARDLAENSGRPHDSRADTCNLFAAYEHQYLFSEMRKLVSIFIYTETWPISHVFRPPPRTDTMIWSVSNFNMDAFNFISLHYTNYTYISIF